MNTRQQVCTILTAYFLEPDCQHGSRTSARVLRRHGMGHVRFRGGKVTGVVHTVHRRCRTTALPAARSSRRRSRHRRRRANPPSCCPSATWTTWTPRCWPGGDPPSGAPPLVSRAASWLIIVGNAFRAQDHYHYNRHFAHLQYKLLPRACGQVMAMIRHFGELAGQTRGG